ncbi:MAG: hypothetical protein LBL93_06170 [Ruminococcus sp.]|jgi:hypothetical protein|nr:hypothetical protein [Ruminococcus sp.]
MSIEEILTDEESIQDLKDLADMFFSDSGEDSGSEETSDNQSEYSQDKAEGNSGGFDWTILFKLQSIFAEYNKEDANTKLLKSIEPFLSDERRERAEKAAKIIKLVSVAAMLKENGMLDDLI